MQLSKKLLDLVYSDTPDGFRIWYQLALNMVLPKHARAWIKKLYAARDKKKGTIVEAFRYSTKTTTMAMFMAYQLGLYPHLTWVYLQVSETSARDNTQLIAEIIEHNPVWKAIFPNVVPDKVKGWGAEGYNLKRTDIDQGEWTRLISSQKDPTFVGYGRTSRSIIGRHPSGGIIIDDLDDENTTRSIRELTKTRTLLTGTIFPAAAKTPWAIIIGTPWNEKDTIHYSNATDEFLHSKTPVYVDIVKQDNPIWPEEFPEEEILRQRKKSGEIEFARMFLLDIEAAKGRILKREWLQDFPYEDIDPKWPEFMGIDYASTSDQQKSSIAKDYDAERDEFAVAWGRQTPQGTLIIEGGWAAKVSRQESQQRVVAFCSTMPYLKLIGYEAIGSGQTAADDLSNALLLSQKYVPIHPIRSHGGKSKGYRFENVLAVMFQQGKIMLSSKVTDFLEKGINQWVAWDGTGVGHDDIIDSWYMLFAAMASWSGINLPDMQSDPMKSILFSEQKMKSGNPYAEAGRWR